MPRASNFACSTAAKDPPCAGRACDFPALFLAACLHDVVYDPRAGDNEERSATYAEQQLGALGVPSPIVARVATASRRTGVATRTRASQRQPGDGGDPVGVTSRSRPIEVIAVNPMVE